MFCYSSGACSPSWSQRQQNGIVELPLQQQNLKLNAASENGKSGDAVCYKKWDKMGNVEETDLVSQERSESSRKKKTPMCLVNELARHHKVISHFFFLIF